MYITWNVTYYFNYINDIRLNAKTKISFSGGKNNKFEIFIDLLTQKKKKTLAILNSLYFQSLL